MGRFLWARGGARSSFAADIVLCTIRGTPHSHLPLKCEKPRHYLLKHLAPYRSRTQKPIICTIQQAYNNHTTIRAVPAPPLAIPAPRRGEGGRWPTQRAAPTTQDPKGGAGATPRHSCATARRGRPVAYYPKGRPPHPRRIPKAAPVLPLAILRHGAAKAPGGLPEGPPLLSKKVTPRP